MFQEGDIVVLIKDRSNITNDVKAGIDNGIIKVGNAYKVFYIHSDRFAVCLQGNGMNWWVGVDAVKPYTIKSRYPSWL